jgi:hypothetical protein
MALAGTCWMLVNNWNMRTQALSERDAYRTAADRLQRATNAFALRATPEEAGPIQVPPWLELIRLMANELPAGVPGGVVRRPRCRPRPLQPAVCRGGRAPARNYAKPGADHS